MKTRNTGFSGVITMVWCGLLLAAPLVAGANENIGHSTGGIAMRAPQTMTVSERRLLDTTMSHVASLEAYVVEIRARGSEVEILAAENSLQNAENMLISLMAQAAGVPIATITTMHSSGVSYGRIGNDLGVFVHRSGSSIAGHGMVGAQAGGMSDIESMTMTDATGDGHHSTAYHNGIAGNDGYVRRVVTAGFVAGDWDGHHNTTHGYSGNYGGGMGGMH